jgi:hypothetical protein
MAAQFQQQPAAVPPLPNRRSSAVPPRVEEIDWTNISEEDKQVFFSWLDEFFSAHLGRPIGTHSYS